MLVTLGLAIVNEMAFGGSNAVYSLVGTGIYFFGIWGAIRLIKSQ